MKKITLFIAFFAISIGAVWAEEWPVVGISGDGSVITCTSFINLSSTSSQTVHVYYPVERFKGTHNNNNTNNYEYMVYSVQAVKFYVTGLTSATVSGVSVGFEHVTNGQTPSGSLSTTACSEASSSVSGEELTIAFGKSVAFPDLTNCTTGYIHMKLTLTLSGVSSSSATWQGYTISETVLPKTTLSCVRKFSDIKDDDNNHFNIYSALTGDNTSAYAELIKYGYNSSEDRYVTVSNTAAYNQTSSNLQFKEYAKVYKIPEKTQEFYFTTDNYYRVTVRQISGTPFYSDERVIYDNTAFVLHKGIVKINTSGTNGVFKLKYSTEQTVSDVAFIIHPADNGTLPELSGSDPSYVFSKNGNNNNVVNLYFFQGDVVQVEDGSAWASALTNTNQNASDLEYVSYFYNVDFFDVYGRSEKVNDQKNNKMMYISSLPFHDNPLKVKLTDFESGNSDGSYHLCKKINDNTSITPTSDIDGKNSEEISCTLNSDAVLSVYADNDAYLRYKMGAPAFKNGDGNISDNMPLFANSNGALVFKLFKKGATYYNDSVPYWYYFKNDSERNCSTATRTTNAAIHVEKEITSDHYRYFCLPFACKIQDIDVRLIDSDGKPYGVALPLFTYSFGANSSISGEGYDPNKDYYVINKYKGQSADNGGSAVYEQVNETTLQANQPYAFALVGHTENGYEVSIKAIITFKSRGDNEQQPQSFTLEAWNHTESIPVTYQKIMKNGSSDIDARNSGWNMIGNPYFHYLNPSSFYTVGAENSSDESGHQIKYVTTINDDTQESVNHYWIGENDPFENQYYSDPYTHRQIDNNLLIKPFQAFFVQVDADGQIEVNQGTTIATQPYPSNSTSSLPSVSRIPAEEEEIQEHLSVKVTGQDGSFDRTTVINDESRDEHFKMMDDLSKIMNPGVQIYTWYDSVPCAFKELPMRADSTMAIPLGVRVTEAGNYTFALDTNLTFFYGAAMLHDKQMNQYHPLNENGVQISLSVLGEVNDRFEVVIVPSEIPADVEDVQTSESLDAYVHDGRLVVENIEQGSTLSIFDVSGRMLYTAPAAGDFNYQFSAHGVYMVVLQGNTTGSIKVVY